MDIQRRTKCLPTAAACIMAALTYGSVSETFAQSQPEPPVALCIQGFVCETLSSAPPANDGHGSSFHGGKVKFNPGAYVAGYAAGSDPISNHFAEFCDMPNLVGVQVVIRWGLLERGQAPGNYDFDVIRAYYDELAACGLRLVLQIQRTTSGETNPGPSYLETDPLYEGGTFYNANYNDTYVKGWVPAVMDRFIALEAALASEFDELEYFEGIIFPETVHSQPIPHDLDPPAWIDQVKRLIAARVDLWPNTNKIIFFNYLNGVQASAYQDLLRFMESNSAVLGGPDFMPELLLSCAHRNPCDTGDSPRTPSDVSRNRTTAQCHYTGDRDCPNGSTTGIDFRPRMGYMGAVQPPEMGGKEGNYTPQELFYEANVGMEASHVFWWYKQWELDNFFGTDEANWHEGGSLSPEGLHSFVSSGRANPTGPALRCPENYQAGCR